jgi:hypothetical protein
MLCKRSKFGRYRSVLKGMLLVEHSTFSSVSRLLLEEIPGTLYFTLYAYSLLTQLSMVVLGQ